MYQFIETIFMSKELYQTMLDPVCRKYHMTHSEMVILLFLANNPGFDTAADIVAHRRLTKSAVSMAVKALQKRGLVTGAYANGDRRAVHLRLCDESKSIVDDGRAAQDTYLDVLASGFSEEEKAELRQTLLRVADNIQAYYEREKSAGRKRSRLLGDSAWRLPSFNIAKR